MVTIDASLVKYILDHCVDDMGDLSVMNLPETSAALPWPVLIAIALRADLTTTSCAQTGPVRDEHELLVIGWTSAKPTVLVDRSRHKCIASALPLERESSLCAHHRSFRFDRADHLNLKSSGSTYCGSQGFDLS